MSHRLGTCILLYALPLFSVPSLTGRAAASPQEKKPSSALEKTSQKVDACTLLTGAEILAATGEPLEEARLSVRPTSGMRTSLCIFRTPTFAKSVSLSVATQGDRSSPSVPREFWRNQFHPVRQKKGASTAAETEKIQSEFRVEGENEGRKPRAVEGLGDEAFWVGSSISGALYVLLGDAFLRVSVGGIPEESLRLARSKSVASAALARLRSTLPTAVSSLHK
jgi:hypothetical protein